MLEIREVKDEPMALECDKLLTKLMQCERRFNENTKETFIVECYYPHKFDVDNNVLFLAYYDDIPVGYIYGYLKEQKGDFVYNNVARIDALYVLDGYRGRGIAKRLMNEFYNWCKINDVKFVTIGVYKNNIDAYNLYCKEGFATDTYYMTKELQ